MRGTKCFRKGWFSTSERARRFSTVLERGGRRREGPVAMMMLGWVSSRGGFHEGVGMVDNKGRREEKERGKERKEGGRGLGGGGER